MHLVGIERQTILILLYVTLALLAITRMLLAKHHVFRVAWVGIRTWQHNRRVWIVLWTHMLVPRRQPYAETVHLGEVHQKAPLCAAVVGQVWWRWLRLILLSVRSSLAQNAQQECMLLLVMQVARVVFQAITVCLLVLATVRHVGKASILIQQGHLRQALVWHVQQESTHLPWQWIQLMDVMCVRQGFTRHKVQPRAALHAWNAAQASLVTAELHPAQTVWLGSTMPRHPKALA